MLAVKPVYEDSIKKELCLLCGVKNRIGSYLYFAADISDDGSSINNIIGICQFSMKGNENIIEDLSYAPGVSDEEAMLIMAYAVMNFMYRCEVKTVYADEVGVCRSFADKLGFILADGRKELNLIKYYESPCEYRHSLNHVSEN